MKYSKYNVIIIGSGLAGLYLANKLAFESSFPDGILIITKEELFSGSTSLAQGGIVSVIPELNKSDSIESHIKDTIAAGCGLNNINTIKFVSQNSSTVAQELIAMGVDFDKNDRNQLNFTLEGAHSTARILHANGDSTGSVIEKTLCERIKKNPDVDIYTNTIAVEILTDNSSCARGVVIYNCINESFETIYSNNIVIATGGIGQLYQNTTNPAVSTGDGIALAMRAGAKVDNMEYVQFHPTGLYCKNKDVIPLVSESVRGEGAKLVNIEGEYFAKKYHPSADLAPRDIVARAIVEEMKNTNSEFVNLDISQIGIENFRLRFPTITKLCAENNIDISSGLIPVMPVQHYFMGGIKTDINSKTSIENLYAIGECSMTGLHGANRLASNSLLECAVFAHTLSQDIIKNIKNPPKVLDEKVSQAITRYSEINTDYNNDEKIENLFKKLKDAMTDNVGISRNKNCLEYAYNCILKIESDLKNIDNSFSKRKYELLNALLVSKNIVQSALNNTTSIGAHYRSDCTNRACKYKTKEEGTSTDEKLLA